jgi:Raf kinase inhibitor-like YbhB/YbcL family protein
VPDYSYDPYAALPELPSFTLTSADVTDGQPMGLDQAGGMLGVPGGKDVSPQLSWSGFPAATRSFAVTLYDPDAPTVSGFWHWAAFDIPVTTTSLAAGAANTEGGLPVGTVQLRNDAGFAGFVGAAPPAGHGYHRYFYVVYAVDVATLGLGAETGPAGRGFNLFSHSIARARLVPTFEITG